MSKVILSMQTCWLVKNLLGLWNFSSLSPLSRHLKKLNLDSVSAVHLYLIKKEFSDACWAHGGLK